MYCKELFEKISLYIDGYIDDKEKIYIENHIKTCTSCKKIYEDLLTIKLLSPSLKEKFPLKKERKKLKYLKPALLLSLIIIIIISLLFQNKPPEKNAFKKEEESQMKFDPVKIYYTDMIYEVSYGEEVIP
ncbi:MAG: zf-HC2 domain-containing protein [Candidatus Hydrothermales bacterium]